MTRKFNQILILSLHFIEYLSNWNFSIFGCLILVETFIKTIMDASMVSKIWDQKNVGYMNLNWYENLANLRHLLVELRHPKLDTPSHFGHWNSPDRPILAFFLSRFQCPYGTRQVGFFANNSRVERNLPTINKISGWENPPSINHIWLIVDSINYQRSDR